VVRSPCKLLLRIVSGVGGVALGVGKDVVESVCETVKGCCKAIKPLNAN
jgi:hypothetical protein